MFTWSEPHCVPWLSHTEFSEMHSHRNTSSTLPHTPLPTGRKKPRSPHPCLILSCGCPGSHRWLQGRAPLSAAFLPQSQGLRRTHGTGEALRMHLWERAGYDGEVHQPALGSQNVSSWLWLSPFYRQSVLHSSHTHHSQRNCSKAHRCF